MLIYNEKILPFHFTRDRELSNMSFLDIKDPKKREEIVREYTQTLHDIRDASEDDKASGLSRQKELQTAFSPIVSATKESSKEITEELKKNRAVVEKGKEYWQSDFAQDAYTYYKNMKNIDKYYGIQKHDEKYIMGDKEIDIKDNNIHVNGKIYNGTQAYGNLLCYLNQPLIHLKILEIMKILLKIPK